MIVKKYFDIGMRKNHYLIIVIALAMVTVLFRYSVNDEATYYQNYDATYHALLTSRAYNETPAVIHHYLPIVSLGEESDKYIRWGATIPDEKGNYYYTSFPMGGFIALHGFLKAFDLEETVENAFIFSSIILLISAVVFFYLTRIVSLFLSIEQPNAPAFCATVIYLFSTQTLYSHGYVYWGHSLFQPFFLIFLICCFSLFSSHSLEKRYLKKTCIYLFLLSFSLSFIEWTGYLAVAGAMFAVLFISQTRKIKFLILISLALGSGIALLIFIIDFCITVDVHSFFNALKARFMARNISNHVPISRLWQGYLSSYHFFLLLIPIGVWGLLKQNKKRRITLFLFTIILLFSLLENIIMKQHAINYHFDRLKFLALFSVCLPIVWVERNKLSYIYIVITVGAVYSLYKYPTERLYTNPNYQSNLKLISEVKRNCNMCVLGTNSRVRGHINLSFGRGIYEWVSESSLQNIAFNKSAPCVCFITNQPRGIMNNFKFYFKRTSSQDHFYLTDANWIKGIARRHAGFFDRNTPENQQKYQKGKWVKFLNGETRQITHVKVSGKYINVSVTGKILQSKAVGYPYQFKIAK